MHLREDVVRKPRTGPGRWSHECRRRRSVCSQTARCPRCRARRASSEGGDALGQLGLAVRSLILVDDAFGDGLVQLAAGLAQMLLGCRFVTRVDCLAYAAHVGLELGFDGLVAQAGLLVGLDTLDLGLDVRHGW